MTSAHLLRAKILGVWELARQVAPHMKKQRSGRFIVVIDQAGKVPGMDVIASAVSSAAQHAFVKSLSDDLGRFNILVNAVCATRITSAPGESLTPYKETLLGRSLEQQQSGWGSKVPLGAGELPKTWRMLWPTWHRNARPSCSDRT